MLVQDRPTFLWDYDLTAADVRNLLAQGSSVERRWLVERLLTQARWEEIWDYLTPQQVREDLPYLRLPGKVKATWERALELWLGGERR
jgi:hypothetical protein